MFTSLNFSLLNESTLSIYALPNEEAMESETFDISRYNLSWQLDSYEYNLMIIKLTWDQPYAISNSVI